MPWFNLNFSDFIKKRVCKFLINRYLGQFFKLKLTADQICLDLYNGKASVFNVRLCCEAINSIFEEHGLDFEVVCGTIGSISVCIPWNCLMSEDSSVIIDGLRMVLRPKRRAKDDSTTMLESMWSSMSSSMQLAQECLERNEDEETAAATTSSSMDGLEKFAQTIDNILNRIKVKFINTEVRLEYIAEPYDIGVAFIIKIGSFEYQSERCDTPEKDEAEKGDQKTILFSTHTTHQISLEDITFYTEEFRIGDPKKKSRSRNTSTKSSSDLDTTFNSTMTTDPYLSALSSFTDNEMFYNESGSIKNENVETESDESDEEDDDVVYRTEMVMIGKLMNRQEIRLNMKLAENIEGPKVQLQMSIGALLLFITPRQMHMLLLLCDILLNEPPTSCDDSEILKEMSPPRSSRVEEDKKRFGGLMGHQTWSGEDYECSSEYTSAAINKLRPMESDSVFSSNSSSMTSSMVSSASQNTSRRRRAIERDQNADISHFNIRVAGLFVVLLHEDVLVPTTKLRSDDSPLNASSVEKLRYKCEYFFKHVSEGFASCSTSDLAKIGNLLKNACDNNHLRLMFAPIIIDGEERRTVKGNCTKLNLAISRADIHEILDDLCLPVLEFHRKDATTMIPEQPEVSINMEKTFYVLRGSTGRQFVAPRLNLGVTLGNAKVDFDITIFDRLHSLFSSPFSSYMSNESFDQDFVNELDPNSQKIVQSKSKIKVQSECLTLILRFPIVDLRPIHDPDKRPWWQRHVRPDFLVIKFNEFQLNFISPSTYDIIAEEINVLYQETEKAPQIILARASLHQNTSNKYYASSTDYPRIVVQFPTDSQLQEMNENFIREQSEAKGEDTDSDPASEESIKINHMKERESTPFSTKKVCRESDTPHGKEEDDESETLLIPGDREEINNFCDNAMKFSKIQIKVELPVVSVQLKSKHLYEVIYNRIISDILMWESSVPKANPPEVALTLKKPPDSLLNAGMMDSMYAPFTMCKSKINFESGSSATNSESEGESEAVFYSVYEKNRQKKLQSIYQKDFSNNTSFQLHIGQGMVTVYAPVRDSSNHVIPGQLGEFVIKVNSTSIFTVSSYHGNTNLGYFCIQSGNTEMFHCGLLPVPIQNAPLRDINCVLPSWIKSTLYSTPKNSTLSESRGSTKRDMVALAVQIKASPDQGLKRIKISAGVQLATLKYNATLPEHLWLTQLIDMFDIKEDPVPGYTPYTNLTEFHVHLWDCAVDYRPLYYTTRAMATIGNFSVSSNIATGSIGCTLRFVAEEVALCLAPQKILEHSDRPDDNKITSLPSNDLVCIGDLGLFDISLRLNEKVTPLSPKYDLRAAIKDVHIRTCSDSGKALLEFISYLATEGDLVAGHNVDDAQSEASSMQQMNEPEDELLQMKTSDRTAPEVTPTQQQHVNTLMADAMEESIYIQNVQNSSNDSDEIVDLGTDVFFFPDEQTKRNDARFGESSRKIDSCKRRYASEDSISIDSSSYRDDDEIFVRRFEQKEEDSGSINTEMRELLDFESSVMIGMKEPLEDFDPLMPQVEMDLGDISKFDTPPKRQQPPPRKDSSDSDDDFCIVADEERPNYNDVPVQTDDPIRIVDNHFSAPHGKPDLLKAPADFPMAVQRYTLCEMSLVWHMYGGHDFPSDDEKKKEREERDESNRRAFTSHYPMSEVYKMGVSYTKGSPSLTLGGSSGNNQTKLTWKNRGGYGRKHDVLLEIHLNKVRFSNETYPTSTEQASRQVLLVTDLEIRDRLSVSNINKFLYHPTVGFKSRQGNNHSLVVKSLFIRPDPALKRAECCLRISLLPIRLNIDQDSLLFMINFFHELAVSGEITESKANMTLKPHQPPVMMVEVPEAAQELQARKLVSDNLSLLLNDEETKKEKEPTEVKSEPAPDASSPIFFRHIIFSPEVSIRLDYQGKRVEMSHGPLAGLIMGLGQLLCSEIRLKRISYRHGILGLDKLIDYLIQEWLQDIKKRQLPKILGGVGPMYSLVQLFQGIFDLFWLPIEQYQKDGRIVRGLQRGAQSFTARTALAALEITTRLIYLLQITAETAYDMVSPAGPSVRRRVNRKGKRKRIHPPQDIREGMSNAYNIFKDGIGDTATTFMQVAALEHDQKGYSGAVGAVIRQLPGTVVQPIVLATKATNNVLGGLKNELIPNARIEAKEKWKDDDEN